MCLRMRSGEKRGFQELDTGSWTHYDSLCLPQETSFTRSPRFAPHSPAYFAIRAKTANAPAELVGGDWINGKGLRTAALQRQTEKLMEVDPRSRTPCHKSGIKPPNWVKIAEPMTVVKNDYGLEDTLGGLNFDT